MRVNAILISLIVLLTISNTSTWDKQLLTKLAVVITPLADATNYSLQFFDANRLVGKIYAELPFAPEIGEKSCARSHQLLFNEVVRIKQIVKDEVECEIFNVFYEEKSRKQVRSFWILKKNIRLLSELKKNILLAIPYPYTQDRKRSLNNIVTLAWPWYDSITKQFYSAGTRFVRNIMSDTVDHYGAYIFQPFFKTIKKVLIPYKYAVVDYPADITKAIKKMVNLLRQWTAQASIIPYVWGGCSYIHSFADNNFMLTTQERYGQTLSFWTRPDSKIPHSGFECSGLIFRAAQIYGLSYYLKNTATIVHHLEPLTKKDILEDGDLIWYSGHVLLVSDKDNNKVIESVGYKAGFGKIHEVPLSRVFQDITTYDDLLKAYQEKKTIKRLTVAGNIFRTINRFLLLKMNSIVKL